MLVAEVLTLRVTDFQSPNRWRWELTGTAGEFLGDHDLCLDPGSQEYDAFIDLYRHLRRVASPDRRLAHEAELLSGLGEWIGEAIFGPHIGSALLHYAPCAVHVVIPPVARVLATYPLESAIFGPEPLVSAGVSLVLDVQPEDVAPYRPIPKEPVAERLRILALFSVPDGSSALDLRHERAELARQFDERVANGASIDLRVLQYGVTRERLNDVIAEAEGWDIVHISGHGARGALLLERPDGGHDLVSDDDLIEMLRPTKRRLKLVTVSACHSAARTVADNLSLLGLRPAVRVGDEPGETDTAKSMAESMLALNLAQRLDCAVIGMRFPVVDGFAAELSNQLYHYLITKGHPLPRALGLALKATCSGAPSLDRPALSRGTPALLGARALNLKISAPHGAPRAFEETTRMRRFGAQPARFVGRVGLMARAREALAPESGSSGVLFHGMAGVGKTAIVRELGHLHKDAFQELVWYEAPPEGPEIVGSLGGLAEALAEQLPRVPDLGPLLEDPTALQRFLPELTEFLRNERVLIVLDNVEALLTGCGDWRDHRWGVLLRAMTAHAGRSKVLITSRRLPVGLPENLRVEAVHTLSLSESVLLARDLPGLRELIDGDREGVPAGDARRLAVRILNLAQGHPKLLELAQNQTSSLDALRDLLSKAADVWDERGGTPEGFFADGESTANAADYLELLDSWTRTVVQRLPGWAGQLFTLLSCLRDRDRFPFLVSQVLGAMLPDGAPPEEWVEEAVTLLRDNALLELKDEPAGMLCKIHAQIAEIGRRLAGDDLRRAVDQAAGAFWCDFFIEEYGEGGSAVSTRSLLHAAESGVPYLLRAGEWRSALPLVEGILDFDVSKATAARLLPVLDQIVETASEGAGRRATERLRARALARLDPAVAERHVRALYEQARHAGDYLLASGVADDLIRILTASGRLAEALALSEEMIEVTDLAGLGPWSRLSDECTRLDIIARMDPGYPVLAKVQELKERADRLPMEMRSNEPIWPQQVKETILKIGSNAATESGQWAAAHAFDTELIETMRERDADPYELARVRLHTHGPLLRLGRRREARDLVAACQEFFEARGDEEMLGRCRIALSEIDTAAAGPGSVPGSLLDALRFAYGEQKTQIIARTHREIARALNTAEDHAGALPHAMAASLLDDAAGTARRGRSLLTLATCLAHTDRVVPHDLDELCDELDELPGVRFRDLIGNHSWRPEEADQPYPEFVLAAKTKSAQLFFDVHRQLASWDSLLAGVLLAEQGDLVTAQGVEEVLAAYAEEPLFTDLVAVLRELRNGWIDAAAASALHPVPAAIAARAFDRRRSMRLLDIPALQHLWGAHELAPLFGAVVAGARGDLSSARAAAENLDRMRTGGQFHTIVLAHGLQQILEGDFDEVLVGTDEVTAMLLQPVLEHATAPDFQTLVQELDPSASMILPEEA